jgi:hypothetical protein
MTVDPLVTNELFPQPDPTALPDWSMSGNGVEAPSVIRSRVPYRTQEGAE